MEVVKPQVVAITGGAGHIGSSVARLLAEHGHKVRVVDNLSRGRRSNIEGIKGVSFIHCDLKVPEDALASLQGVDAVIHLAASVGGCPFMFTDGQQLHTWLETEAIDSAVLRAAASLPAIKSLVYISTACCYPRAAQAIELGHARPLGEAQLLPANPESGYGWAKLSGELKLRLFPADAGIVARVVRLHNVYGPRMCFDKSGQVIAHLIKKAIRLPLGQPLPFGGSGDQFRDFLHVDDAARAILLALTASSDAWPNGTVVPFGSGVATTIRELAELIASATGRVGDDGHALVTADATVPEGDKGRYCDLTAASALGWEPLVDLRAGMKELVDGERRRLQCQVAIGLPVTSRGTDLKGVEAALGRLAASLPEEARVYVAVDENDPCLEDKPVEWFEGVLRAPCSLMTVPVQRPFPVYKVYNKLFEQAFSDGMQYFVLLGDDVSISSKGWFQGVKRVFQARQDTAQNVPFGFGVVAIVDETSPGFPTFPVVHRLHGEIFGGKFCPEEFHNQDADPWVWEVYRRFGAASFLSREVATLQNQQGGALGIPRYQRSVERVRNHVHGSGALSLATITLDVVVPTYRMNIAILEGIVGMEIPLSTSTLFIVIIDNPQAPNIADVLALERRYQGRVRVRVQPKNMGVSAARNRGIAESAADWILFLDDDVVPGPNTLAAYSDSIRKFGAHACGFAGPTEFPEICNLKTAALTMSYLTYFWDLPTRSMTQPRSPSVAATAVRLECPTPATLAWGVTANLVLRRYFGLSFDTRFPFTGGGEDIAACLQSQNALDMQLLCCPGALVTHPWWEQGDFSSWRFFNWTQGDGLLLDMFPQHRYVAPPNAVELCAAVLALASGALIAATLFPPAMNMALLLGAWLILILLIDTGVDLHHYLMVDKDIAMGWTGSFTLYRVTASMLGTVYKNHVELGHLWVQLKRGRWYHICHRFDYYCGLNPQAILEDYRRKSWSFLLQITPALLYCAMVVA